MHLYTNLVIIIIDMTMCDTVCFFQILTLAGHGVYAANDVDSYSTWLQPPQQPPPDVTRLYDLQGKPL